MLSKSKQHLKLYTKGICHENSTTRDWQFCLRIMSFTFFLVDIDINRKFPFRWVGAESSKYDIEYTVKVRDMQIHDLEMEVSDMRGKFIIPKLKKVHTFKLMDES